MIESMKLQEIKKLILNTYEQVYSKKLKTFRGTFIISLVIPIFVMVYCFNTPLLSIVAMLIWSLGFFLLDNLIKLKKTKKLNIMLQELMKKIENYQDILNNDLLSDKSVNIIKFYDLLKMKEIINKTKNYLCWLGNYDEIFNKLESVTKIYQKYILQNNPKQFEVQVNCNFSDISVLYCSEKNIVDLLTYEGFDIFDMIDNRISYQNELVKKNLHKSLNINNIRYIENIFNNFPDKQKNIIDFLISVKGGVFDKNQGVVIRAILGSFMYDIFEKHNTVNLLTIEDTVKCLKTPEIDNYQKDKSKFMRYLSKAL